MFGESLVIWADAMRPLEDAGKNGWTVADFSVMRVAVDLGPHQIGRTDWMSDQLSQPSLHRYQPSDVRSARVSIIHRWRIERNLRSYRPLRHLPLTPAHCRIRLQWCLARSGLNHADWGRIVFSDESRFPLRPDDHRRRICRRPRTACQSCFL
ncbi:uncharacterized protein TNCV_3843291 [Trichonephila clavipes]|nr:uncharacterized protein TNCV_3843291 [Trichonephila clavipes]